MNLQRALYLSSRTVSDYQAAKRGRLAQRLVKRAYHRRLIGVLRRGGVWR